MNKVFKKLPLIAISLLVGIYFTIFIASYLFYGFSVLTFDTFFHREILWWTLIGLCFSFLASLCAWPFSLSLVTLLRQYQFHPLARGGFRFIHFSASLPLVLFLYIFMEVIGPDIFMIFEKFWTDTLASGTWLTRTLAFILTVLLYPIGSMLLSPEESSVDVFFGKMLETVIEFFQIGLFSSTLVFILTIFILPKMVVTMHQCLLKNRDIRGLEVIQSVGGTWWESLSITMIQSMRDHFNMILTRFIRICFFESLITFSVLRFFLAFDIPHENYWGATPTSNFIFESLKPNDTNYDSLLILAGGLGFSYLLLMAVERYYSKPLLKDKVEIF